MDRRPIFDTVRRLMGRSFRSADVAALDAAIDASLKPPTAHGLSLSPAGLALIQRWEGCARRRPDGRFEAYPDPGSSLSRTGSGSGAPWTIGWGATGADIVSGLIWTQTQCDERLVRDLDRFAREVAQAPGDSPTTQPQFDALVSFHYNTGAIGSATLTRRHKSGDFTGAADEFERWVHAGGKRLNGLIRRRADEAALYRSG